VTFDSEGAGREMQRLEGWTVPETEMHIHDCVADGVPFGTPAKDCEECESKRVSRISAWIKVFEDDATALENRLKARDGNGKPAMPNGDLRDYLQDTADRYRAAAQAIKPRGW
jgi:hypothetical protein